MKSFIIAAMFLIIPGLFAIFYSALLLKGKGNKWLYMTDDIYTGRVYTGFPLGIAMLMFFIAGIPQSQTIKYVILTIGISIGLLGLIFAFIQPSFLKPAWLKWLEREHGDIMPLLREEVKQIGLNVWNDDMQTQEDIEAWAAEVRRKHHL